MKNYKIKYLSKKAKLLLATGSLLLLAACGKTDTDKATATDAADTATEATTDTEALTETTTEAMEVNNDYQAEYDIIDGMEEDIVEFAEKNLPNGFGSVEITEDNKLDIAEQYIDSYVTMNLSTKEGQINPTTVAILNQNNKLIPTAMKDNYAKKFVVEVGKYMRIVEPSTMIDFELLVQEQDDAKFLNDLESEIANMNVATTSKDRQTRINNIKTMIDSIDPSTTSYSSSTIYMAVNMVIRADGMARAYGDQIFEDEEAKLQLYTTYEDICSNEAAEFGFEIEDVKASATSFESMNFSSTSKTLDYAIMSSIEDGKEYNYSNYYSMEELKKRVADRLLGFYKKPEMDSIAKENAIREKESVAKTPVGTTTVQTDVPASEVPESERVEPTTTSDHSDEQTTEDANKVKPAEEANDVYIQAKGAGITDGSAAAANAYQTNYAGNAAGIPYKPEGNKPADNCTNYNDIYNYYYNRAWNQFRAEAVAMEAAAKQENEEATTEYVPVDNGTEIQVDEPTTEIYNSTEATTQSTTQSTTESTTQSTTESTTQSTTESNTIFIPVDDGEEIKIDEQVETVGSAADKISIWKNLKTQIGLYAFKNGFEIYYEENNGVKRV